MYFLYDSIFHYSNQQYLKIYNRLHHFDKRKVDLLAHDDDKKLFLVSRILLSKLALKYYDCDFFDLDIYYNKYGKPLTDSFYFNLSHSHDYVVVACSKNRIGVDIEKIRDVDWKMIDFFCNSYEKKFVLNSKDKNKAFFSLFCLKEAYFKMIGSSIRNFSDIEFRIHDNRITCLDNYHLNIYLCCNIDGYVFTIIEEKY